MKKGWPSMRSAFFAYIFQKNYSSAGFIKL